MACLDADTAAAYAAHALEEEEARAIDEHIDTCASCRELVSMVARAGWSMSTAASGQADEGEPTQAVLPRGTRIGPFVLDAPLDAGGMGVVYAAHDERLDRRVALKCLRERRGDPRQLMREAKLMAQLASPNVVPIYDLIEAHGQVFIAMELVVGRSLRQWMKAGPRDWRTVTGIFLEAGAGLAAAHAAGIIHGDVKPANILVGEDGRVRVTDFGLASLVTEHAGMAEGVRGTPAYLAPEQWTGTPCDARGDQYAFCVSLYEALMGALPGSPLAWMPGLPRSVRRALAKGLQADPALRHPSMEALLLALRAARSRRWRWVMATSAGVVASVGLAYAVGGRRVEVEQCAVAASELASPWNETEKARLRSAFELTRLPYAGETADRVVTRLDQWRTDFEGARRQACSMSWFRRETPLEGLPGQLSCLKDRAREVRALISQLRDADTTVVQNSVAAVEQLTQAGRCSEAEPRQRAAPEGPAVDSLREQFATTRALMESGKFRAALPISTELMRGAEALGDATFIAAAKVALGNNQAVLADYAAATSNLLDAIRLADVAQDERVRAQAWVSLAQTEFWQGHYEKVLFMKGPAMGACERVGDAWLRSELLLFLGGSLCQLGKAGEAQPLFEEAVRLRTQVYGEKDRRTSFALSSLGNALAMQGDLEGGIEAHRKALVAAQASLGANHPSLGTLHGNLGSDYLYGLQGELAVAELEKSKAIAEAANGPRQLKVALAQTSLGFALLESSAPERALDAFEQAADLWRILSPKHPVHGQCLLGKNQAALALGMRVSQTELEQALELGQVLPGYERGRIQLALGKALASGKKAPPAAVKLVQAAREGLMTSKLPLVQRDLGRAEAWLRAQGVAP